MEEAKQGSITRTFDLSTEKASEGMSFGTALSLLKKGKKIRRKAWLSPTYYLYIDARMPSAIAKIYDKLYLTDEDLLAHDWGVKE